MVANNFSSDLRLAAGAACALEAGRMFAEVARLQDGLWGLKKTSLQWETQRRK